MSLGGYGRQLQKEAEAWKNDPDDGKITLWIFIIIIALTAGVWAINAHGKKGV